MDNNKTYKMIDYQLFRARIGLNNLKRMSSRSKKFNIRKISGYTAHMWTSMIFFAVGLVCLTLCLSLTTLHSPKIYKSNTKYINVKENVSDAGLKNLFSIYKQSIF